MLGRAWYFGFALIATLAAILPQRHAAAANAAEKNIYLQGPHFEGVLPRCDDPSALRKIASHFNDTQATFWSSWSAWGSSLSIKGYEQIRETAFRPWAGNTIPRRFCSAIVYISDGSKRPLHYSIGEDTGMIGMSWGVEWCVVGLDRNWAYNPACKLAEP